jgi:hypothetical protein
MKIAGLLKRLRESDRLNGENDRNYSREIGLAEIFDKFRQHGKKSSIK